jgi:UDP-apiose/xylose synthase
VTFADLVNSGMKNILILGAGGFIGSHLTEALMHQAEYNVIGVDINSEKLQDASINPIYHSLNISHDKQAITELIREAQIVVNLVAIANPGMYVVDPLRTFQLDFMDNLFVVEECVKYRKRLIQFSSSEVYGKSASTFTPDVSYGFDEDESHLILGPVNKHRWIYSCSKQLLERVIHAHGLQSNLDYTVIRPFNYIGPRIDFLPSHEDGIPRVFSYFMDALLYNKPMQLVNGGLQMRCYTDIRDATNAHVLIISDAKKQARQQIINVGHKRNEITIKGLAEKMNSIWNSNYGTYSIEPIEVSGEEFYGEGYDDSDRRIPVSKKIEKMGWSPKYSVDDILEHSMSYYFEKFGQN